jgi:hypothetical protein
MGKRHDHAEVSLHKISLQCIHHRLNAFLQRSEYILYNVEQMARDQAVVSAALMNRAHDSERAFLAALIAFGACPLRCTPSVIH